MEDTDSWNNTILNFLLLVIYQSSNNCGYHYSISNVSESEGTTTVKYLEQQLWPNRNHALVERRLPVSTDAVSVEWLVVEVCYGNHTEYICRSELCP